MYLRSPFFLNVVESVEFEMLISKDALDPKQCDNKSCRRVISLEEGVQDDEFFFCIDCYQLSSAIAWLFMMGRGYDVPTSLVGFYVA